MSADRVSLFIPCLVDQVYPEMGWAMVDVLERAGLEVAYDTRQTCCGQPAFNAGHRVEAREVARGFLDVFDGCETIVCPSGSCTSMVRRFLSLLFEDESERTRARRVGSHTFEFSEFLCTSGHLDRLRGERAARVGFHNSCHSMRELGLRGEPLDVLRRIQGVEVVELQGEETCCGFGGLFSVKFASISSAMSRTRLEQFVEAGAEIVVSNDPGCILQLRQEASARDLDLPIVHLAEFLAAALGTAGAREAS